MEENLMYNKYIVQKLCTLKVKGCLKNEKCAFNSSLLMFVLFNRIKILAGDKKREWMSM